MDCIDKDESGLINVEQCKSWVASRFTVVEDCGLFKRRCRFVDCGKEYSRGTSHMILKRHWSRAHADIFSLSPRSRASFGEAPGDRATPSSKPPPIRPKKTPSGPSPQKTGNSCSASGKKKNNSSQSFTTLKPNVGDKLQFDVKQVARRLKETLCIHLTFDIHTPKKGGKTFGIITAHSLNDSNKIVKSVLLEYRHLPYPDDSTSIYEFLRSCVTKFNCREKIISIASNGSDIVTSAIYEFDKRYKLAKNFNFSTVHIRCFPQFVHLNVNDVFRSQENLIESIRKVVNFINHNNFTMRPLDKSDPDAPEGTEGGTVITNSAADDGVTDANNSGARATGLKLPIDANRSSWNTTYNMIETFLQQRGFIEPTLSYFQNTQDLANIAIDWDRLYTLVHLLRPFHDVISKFVQDEYAPVSLVAAIIPHLMDHLSNSTWVYDDLAMAAHNFKSQLDTYRQTFQSDLTVIAGLLDPRIKDSFTSPEGREEVIHILRNRVRDYPSPPPPKYEGYEFPEDSIFNSIFKDVNPDEIAEYLATPRQFGSIELYSYWEAYKYCYPMLYNLARSLLCVQASSVPSDRMFAAAEHTERERKGQVDSTVPKELIRSWAKYLEK